ncbi:hypothetical protein Taro_003125 [Colocasia esculenta]|uniref:Uncharacterized protein n=1 Tax=Colocasia esculenta TaxID=4460 RepID=A0A843TG66_COLES|nr:hypothetical protein [Colocasia esculenta]
MAACSPPKLLAPLLLLLLLLLLASPALARSRHVVAFRAPGLRPSSLLWDSAAQHFLVGSRGRPAVTSVSDAGVVEAVVSDPDLPADASLPSLALDPTRRRLLAVVAGPSPACLAAYDLRSPRPHRRLFLTPLPEPADPAAVAIDPAMGAAFVTSASGGVIWRVDLQGEASVFSRSEALSGGLAGIAHVRKGYLLAVQTATGNVIKVDAEDGKARAVLIGGKNGVAGAEAIAIRGDGSAAVVGGSAARIVTSDDGWGEAGVYDKLAVGGRAGGVAVREGRKVYVLIEEEVEGSSGKEEGGWGYRVEEMEWERDREGEWVVGLVLLGLGLAYFLYWRFQMGRLVKDMNKKRL